MALNKQVSDSDIHLLVDLLLAKMAYIFADSVIQFGGDTLIVWFRHLSYRALCYNIVRRPASIDQHA